MSNLKIPCPEKDENGVHRDTCFLCNGKGFTVIPATYTDEPVTEIVTFSYTSTRDYRIAKTYDGFGRLVKFGDWEKVIKE